MRNHDLKKYYLVFLTFAAVGIFANSAAARPIEPISDQQVAERLAYLSHRSWDGKSIVKEVEENFFCVRSKQTLVVEDPLNPSLTREIEIEFYRPKVGKKVPFVIVVPTIEGPSMIERKQANNLCEENIAAAIADVNDTNLPQTYPAWGLEDIHNRSAILALQTVLDFAEKEPHVDASKMGIVGSSLGGIITGLLAGVDDSRLKAIVSIVGAGNMPLILTKSDHGKIETLRDGRMKAMGWKDLNLYENKLRETMLFDSLYFNRRVHTDRLFMVISDVDKKVPAEAQAETYKAFGKPQGLAISGGHVEVIVAMTYLYFDDVVSFLNKKFKGAAAAAKGEFEHRQLPTKFDYRDFVGSDFLTN